MEAWKRAALLTWLEVQSIKRAALSTWLEVQKIKRDIERDAQP